MNLLFAHDFFQIKNGSAVYADRQFPAGLWDRYLHHFDCMTVASRRREIKTQDVSDLAQTSRPSVEFESFPSLSSVSAQLTTRQAARRRMSGLVDAVDAVIARLPSQIGLLAAAEAERAGKPWLIEMAGCPWDGLWHYGNWKGKAYAPVMAIRTRWTVARAPFVTYVTSEFLQRRYPNRGGRQIACSDVQIDTPSRDVLEQRLARINRQDRSVRLGLIGTLKTRYKGIQTVFAALARLRHKLPPLEFHVLGAGDPQPWLDEARSCGVGDLVHFDGSRNPGDEVMAWLDEIDVYLQPSFKEGLPRATIEAMSRGCPVIGSTCAGIPELLSAGCCIEPGDDKELARLLGRAVAGSAWQQQQAEANWREAHEYSRETLDARRSEMLSAFAEAVERGKRQAA